MKNTFTKSDRILKRSEFLRLSRTGKKYYNRHFIANVCPAAFERTRLGITVTKRVGKAVTRNRIKRLCREYFRLNKHQFASTWDINIIAKTTAATLSAEQFFKSMQNLFDRIHNDGH